MPNTTSVREQLTFKAGLQVFFLVASIVLSFVYTLPTLDAVGAQVEQTNIAVQKYNSLHNDGIAPNALVSSINRVGDNKELVELVASSTGVADVLKKTWNDPYLTWIINELNNSGADRAILDDQRSRVNTIIPTLSPVSNNRDADSVTLRDYITFMESEILGKYNLVSLSPLGIDGITYGNKEASTGAINSIGEFKVELNFEASNQNIINFLDYIDKMGEPSIFESKELLANKPKVMSNPLVSIDSLVLSKIPNKDYPYEKNTGRIALKFYVRGSSSSDQDYLVDTFKKRRAELREKMESTIQKCEETSCVSLASYKAVQQKFLQFERSAESSFVSKKGGPVETVYMLGQQIQSLKAISDEFENIK